MENTSADEHEVWMEITPSGRRSSPLPLSARLIQIRQSASMMMLLARFNLYETTAGTVLGEVWLIIEPLMMAALYFFLIVILFGVRGNDVSFQYLLVSITFWRLHSVLLENSPRLIFGRSDLVKQSNFSVITIIYETVFTRIGYFLFSLVVMGAALWYGAGIVPHWSWIYMLPVLIAQLVFTLSLVMLFSALGTFVKDIPKFISFFVAIWWYMSPILYGVSRIPEKYREIFLLNPFAHLLPAYQNTIFSNTVPDYGPVFLIFLGSSIFLVFTTWFLLKVRLYFYKFL
jgi:ABC-type polysaccharide/polyol phosphate export permease